MGKERKKAFLIYCDYKQHLELLSQEDCGKLFISLIEYADTGIPPKLTGAAAMAFSFIKAQLDRDEEKYEERCSINRQNGSKGGRPRKSLDEQPEDSEDATENNRTITEKTERFSAKPQKPDTDTNTDKETETDTDTENDTVSLSRDCDLTDKKSTRENQFSEFWTAYPKKIGKASCLKAWLKLKPNKALFETIMRAIEQQKYSDQWTKESGRFIPNPLTWLNQGRWDDEMEEARRTSFHSTNSTVVSRTNTMNILQSIVDEEEGRHGITIPRNGTPAGFKDD